MTQPDTTHTSSEPTELVDVAKVPLDQLVAAHGDSPVLRSIRRLQSSLNDPNAVVSAFSSFIDEEGQRAE